MTACVPLRSARCPQPKPPQVKSKSKPYDRLCALCFARCPQPQPTQVKAMTACIASGIGDLWEMCEALNAWDGFWVAVPSAQALRAVAYMLRMLCFAECAPRPGCNEHRLRAAVASVAVQVGGRAGAWGGAAAARVGRRKTDARSLLGSC